jgi:hypothetical protein
MCIVFDFDDWVNFLFIQSTLHEIWAWKYCSTNSISLRYTPSSAFETFPIPHINKAYIHKYTSLGESYHVTREKLMSAIKTGLTKTYNYFHSIGISERVTIHHLLNIENKAIEKQFGKEVGDLWNHLQKTEGTCSFEEAVKGIIKLRELHVEMDNAVLEAYGWQDIDLRHDFYEVDYLPENDRVRFTIHPDARKEVLKRLLEMNHKIHEEEVKAGLWDQKKSGKKKSGNTGTTKDQVNEPEAGYGGLFDLT